MFIKPKKAAAKPAAVTPAARPAVPPFAKAFAKPAAKPVAQAAPAVAPKKSDGVTHPLSATPATDPALRALALIKQK